MKVKVTIEGEIPNPKVGEQYCDWGIGGRSGFSCSNIKKITKKYIMITQSAPFRSFENLNEKDIIDKIPIEDYIFKHLIYHVDAEKKTTVKILEE